MYTLKASLKVNCFYYSKCKNIIEVKWCPPRQKYSHRNNWGYWTEKSAEQKKYICDDCLINMYRNHKQTYLNSITDSRKRRAFRLYFGGKIGLVTECQQKDLKEKGLHNILRKKGIDLEEDGLDDYLESWRQTVIRLVKENSLQAKKIRQLEKQISKMQKGQN